MNPVEVTVIICSHNPNPGRLARTLAGLRAQTLPAAQWDCVLVDNASEPTLESAGLPNLRVVREPLLGLSRARRRGLIEGSSFLCVFSDDDNVLAPNYLEEALRIARGNPRIGALGGRSIGEFENPVAEWQKEFLDLLAVRDLGAQTIVESHHSPLKVYPRCAPIGAGMVLRREAAQVWMDSPQSALTDRRGADLSSSGDNDIVLTLFAAGWDVAYFPELALIHLIPTDRLTPDYLARLNEGIQRSWVRVLSLHGLCPWAPAAPWTVPIRSARAWFRNRAWHGPAQRIRWFGARGHFRGRADLKEL